MYFRIMVGENSNSYVVHKGASTVLVLFLGSKCTHSAYFISCFLSEKQFLKNNTTHAKEIVYVLKFFFLILLQFLPNCFRVNL